MRVWLFIHIYPFKTLPFAISRVDRERNSRLSLAHSDHTMADPSPLLCQSNSCTDDQESSDQRSHKQSISSLDEIVEQGIGGFGWAQFVQAILVSLASLFDSQQSFISVYTEAEPTWHCLNNTTCSSASNICMFPKSSWAWDGNPTTTALTIISEGGLECSSTFIKGLPAASHFTGCLLGIVFWPRSRTHLSVVRTCFYFRV